MKKPWSEDKINKYIEPLLSYTEKHLLEDTATRRLTNFLVSHYKEICIPNSFYSTVLAQVYNGTYKKFGTPVPPVDLLDMWQSKAEVLDRIYAKKKSNLSFKDESYRLHYDLAVLLSNYPKYLEFKNKQKNIIKDVEEELNQNISFDYLKASEIVNKNYPKEKKEDDISEIVNDIFQ